MPVNPFIQIFTALVFKVVIAMKLKTSSIFPKTNQNMLSPEDKEKCEGLLTKEECLQALKDMSLNKTPGSDGLIAPTIKDNYQ